MGLFRRNPSDIVFLPLSIAFGYFHGLIKLYALFTLNMVCVYSRKATCVMFLTHDKTSRLIIFADLLGQPGRW